MSEQHEQLLRHAYEAFNAHDVQGALVVRATRDRPDLSALHASGWP